MAGPRGHDTAQVVARQFQALLYLFEHIRHISLLDEVQFVEDPIFEGKFEQFTGLFLLFIGFHSLVGEPVL